MWLKGTWGGGGFYNVLDSVGWPKEMRQIYKGNQGIYGSTV